MTEITDDMCRRAINSLEEDRLQGFSTPLNSCTGCATKWGAPYYIRDVYAAKVKQVIWRGMDHAEMMERLRIERMRRACHPR